MSTSATPLKADRGREAKRAGLGLPYTALLKAGFAVLLGIWLIFTIYQTADRVVHYYIALPVWDYWRVIENLDGYRNFDALTLWRQHNEHRILFPKLAYAADVDLWHGRQILPLVLSSLSYLSFWLILSWTFLRDRAVSPTLRSAGTSLAGIIILWSGSAVVLATPFLLQWTLLLLAVASSLLALSRVPRSSSGLALAASIGSAAVGTYTSGNGFLVWPVLLAGGCVLQIGRRRLIILAVSAFAIVGLYFVGYTFSHDLNLRNFLDHPGYSLEFIGAYVGMPFSVIKSPRFGISIGLSAIVVTLGLIVIAARKQLIALAPAVVMVGFALFCLLSAVLVAAGRMEVSDPTLAAAKASRYVVVPLAGWGAFILFCLWMCSRCSWRYLNPHAVALSMGLLLLFYLPKMRVWLAGNANEFAEQQTAALSIEDGLLDPNLMKRIYPDLVFLANLIPRLQQNQLSSWYKARSRWFGQPVDRYSRISPDRVPGQVTTIFPLQNGLEVMGWADDDQLRAPYRWIVLADGSGRIAGFGERIPAGFPSSHRNLKTPPFLGWIGFVAGQHLPTSLSVYVVDARRGGLYPLEGPVSVPTARPVSAGQAGAAAIPGVTWTDTLQLPNSSLPGQVNFGRVPAGSVRSTWNGSDANSGELTSSPIAAPASACIVLPILHGPSTTGLSLSVLDADTGTAVAALPLRDADQDWTYWRIPLPASSKRFRIVARDAGTGWGQWLAVSDPLACR